LDIAPTLQGVDAVITDPPYGMGYKPQDWKKWNGTPQAWKPIIGDENPFDPAPWLAWPIVAMWGASYYMGHLPTGKTLVWDKRCHPDGDKMFGASIEVGWCPGNGEAVIKRLLHGGVVNADSLKGNNAERLHPTQKPVNLMKWTMDEAKVPAGAVVLDPYMGSGTTGIACIRTGRRFVGIEKDPTHYATALKRIKNELAQGDLFLGHNAGVLAHADENLPNQ
jgi:DNA modification methylase